MPFSRWSPVAYYLSKNRVYRNVVLLLASLLFYSWGEPRFLLLMLAATLAAYCGGLLMERCTAHRKLILIVTVVLLVGNLFVFKYLNFFSENLSALFGWSALPKLTLPIGISFYIFPDPFVCDRPESAVRFASSATIFICSSTSASSRS